MVKHPQTASKIKLSLVLIALVITTGGCSSQPAQVLKEPSGALQYSNLSYDEYLFAILTEAEKRQALLLFAAEKQSPQGKQWRYPRSAYHYHSATTNELTASWHLLDKGLYNIATKKHALKSSSKANADTKHLLDFIRSQQDSLITSAFTTYFYDSATKQKFKRRHQLIKHSLAKSHHLPQTAENALLLLTIKNQAADLEELYQAITSETQTFHFAILRDQSKTNAIKASFNSQIPNPDDLIMNHPHLISIMIHSWRNDAIGKRKNIVEFKHNENLWRKTIPTYPYLLPTKTSLGAPPVEAWYDSSKTLLRELEQAEQARHSEKKTTPRGIDYNIENERKIKQAKQLFEITIMARLRIALLDYAHRYHLFKTLKQQASLQKILTPQLVTTAHPDQNTLLNNIRLCSLEIQTHLAYSQLLASLVRANASANFLSQNPNTPIVNAKNSASSMKNLLEKGIETIFVSSNISALGQNKKLEKPQDLKAVEAISKPPTKLKKVETLSTLSPHERFNKQTIKNSDRWGIRLLYAKSHDEFVAHRSYSGLRNLPYRTQLKGYDTHYSIYYATFPSKEDAAKGLREIPPFYQLFKPEIRQLPD